MDYTIYIYIYIIVTSDIVAKRRAGSEIGVGGPSCVHTNTIVDELF